MKGDKLMSIDLNLSKFDVIFMFKEKKECVAVKGNVLHIYGISGNHYYCEYPTKEAVNKAFNDFTGK